jgi:branched-subunit amino acid ABC-type transport system permease component
LSGHAPVPRSCRGIFVISLLNGISYGLLLFMLSSGLTLIFSMMGVLNFAHASFYMLGAYFAYTIAGKVGFWPALILAPLLVAALGRWWSASACAPCISSATSPNCCSPSGWPI